MAEPGAAADGGRDAGFPGLSLSARPPLLSFSVRLTETRLFLNAEPKGTIVAVKIELTPEQQQALDHEERGPHRIVDPRNDTAYVLVRETEYEAMRELLEDERREHGIHAVALLNAAARFDENP